MKGYKYAVIGLGLFGSAIARALSEKGAEVLAIDNEDDNIQDIKDEVAYAVTLDATNKRALSTQGIEDMDAVVVAIGEDFEALLLCTVYLLEMNVKRIIARANGVQQRMILEKIGVKEILSPENEVGKVVAERLLNPNIISYLQLPDNYEIVEIVTPKGIINRKLEELELRNKYKLNLITIKRQFEETVKGDIVKEQHVLGVPHSNSIIEETDTLVIFGRIKDIERFCEINS
jgi:trk system potassium uptake protein TrkA